MKRLFAILLVLCLVLPCCLGVSAAETHVYDEAVLLSDSEVAALEARAAQLSSQYNCGVYLVILNDFRDYAYSVESASEEIFAGMNFGIGAERDGVMLLLSMDDRDYDLDSHGTYANSVFTSGRKDNMEDAFLDYLHDNEWYDALSCFLDGCENYFQRGPVVKKTVSKFGFGSILASLVLGAGIAGISCGVMKSNMKSVAMASQANAYLNDQGVDITNRIDMFTHRTTVRRKIESSSSSGSGGSGHSHSSGKF